MPIIPGQLATSGVASVGGGTQPVLTQAVNVNNNSVSTRGSPSAALSPDGELYVVWQDSRSGTEHIYFASSADGGVSFGPNKRVDDAPKGSRQLKPAIAVSEDGDIFVAWQDNRRYVFDFDIYFACSRDGGKTFSQNIKVDDSVSAPVSWQESPSITVDMTGNPVVAWTDDRTHILRTRVAVSTDEGLSFLPSTELTAGFPGTYGQAGVDFRYSGSRLFATFIDNCSGLPHPYLSWSTDGGRTFVQPVRLDNTASARQRSVSLASLPNNGAIVVWEDSRGGDWDIYGATISPSGAVTASNYKLNDGERGTNQANPSIIADPTGIFVAWEDDRQSRFAVRLTYALIGTTSFASSVEVASPGNDDLQGLPSAAASKNRGGFFVVWQESTATTDQVLESRGYVPGQAAPWIWALSPKTSPPGASLTFQATAYDPDSAIVRYTWDFGDGSENLVGNPVIHAYNLSGEYTFTVYVDDLSGLPGHNMSVSSSASIGFLVSLSSGWNFVNLPLVGTSYMASTLGLSPGDMIVRWNPLTQSYDKTFIAGISPPFMDFPVTPGSGYWIFAGGQRSVMTGGAPATAPQTKVLQVPVGGGLAAIGMCSMKTTWKASSLVTMVSGASVTSVVAWHASTQSWQTYVAGYPFNDFSLVPGQAYWVYLTGSGVLSYSP
jgi:hypothetical protein